MSVPICFWITSFFCLIRWMRTTQSSYSLSNPVRLLSNPLRKSSSADIRYQLTTTLKEHLHSYLDSILLPTHPDTPCRDDTLSYRKSVLLDIVGEEPLVELLDNFILHAYGVSAGLQFLCDLEVLVALFSAFMPKNWCFAAWWHSTSHPTTCLDIAGSDGLSVLACIDKERLIAWNDVSRGCNPLGGSRCLRACGNEVAGLMLLT